MTADPCLAAQFYATPRGVIAGELLRERLKLMWPSLDGMALLGVGFASPYVRAWSGNARRVVVATPPQVGVVRWPTIAGNLCCLAEDGALPFPDLAFDRILLVHGLEATENARSLLREVWRVLKDDGRLLVVAPNRTGLWAHVEATPFGHGRPYSRGQVDRLLSANLFRIERRERALFVPPVRSRLVLRGARAWEAGGRLLAPRLAGVTITEAVKDVYAAIPVRAGLRRLVLSPAA